MCVCVCQGAHGSSGLHDAWRRPSRARHLRPARLTLHTELRRLRTDLSSSGMSVLLQQARHAWGGL